MSGRNAEALRAHRGQRWLGWLVIVLGVILMPLPGPGVVIVALGIAVLGPREPALRRAGLWLRLGLRRMRRARSPLVRVVGGWLWRWHRGLRRTLQRLVAERQAGRPLPWWLWLFIVVSGAWLVVSVGAGVWLMAR